MSVMDKLNNDELGFDYHTTYTDRRLKNVYGQNS